MRALTECHKEQLTHVEVDSLSSARTFSARRGSNVSAQEQEALMGV